MSTVPASPTDNIGSPVTLDNCAREPIHIPGAIQPHGALLAFDRLGRLAYQSTNAGALLGLVLQLGRTARLPELAGDEPVYRAMQQAVADIGTGEAMADSHEVRLNGRTFDLVAHAHAGFGICEFELRYPASDIPAQARRLYVLNTLRSG